MMIIIIIIIIMMIIIIIIIIIIRKLIMIYQSQICSSLWLIWIDWLNIFVNRLYFAKNDFFEYL